MNWAAKGIRLPIGVCQELGYRRVDKALLSEIAQQGGVNIEAILAVEHSFATRSRLVSTDMLSLYSKQPTAFDDKQVIGRSDLWAEIVRKAMEQYAEQGNVVIVGRGGQMVLRYWPTALHVYLYAPVDVRVQRLMQRVQHR